MYQYKSVRAKNNLIVILLAYILLYPVFEDLGIRWSVRFLLFLCLAMLDICVGKYVRVPLRMSRIVICYIIFASVILLSFFLQPSRRDVEIVSYMLVLVFCLLFVLFANSSYEQIRKYSRILVLIAIILACYVIFSHFFRNIYIGMILPRLPEDIRVYNNWLLNQGYGVPVGGSIVYADYVMCTAGLGIFSSLAFRQDKKAILRKIALLALFLIAMYLEGRRGELLCFMIALLLVFAGSMYKASTFSKSKKLIVLILAVIACLFILLILLRSGSNSRLAITLQELSAQESNTDISTGRFNRWKLAIQWFKESPVFGMGWGQYGYRYMGKTDIVTTYINFKYAHNDYLNVLCEMGVVGAAILYGVLLFIFVQTIRQGMRLIKLSKSKEEAYPYVIVNSFCFGAQVFWAVLGIIDPVLYKEQFLCYYALIVICLKMVEQYYKETVKSCEVLGNKATATRILNYDMPIEF